MPHRRHGMRAGCLALAGICALWTSTSFAHEGHAPLPTRGAEVDLQQGLITLSAEARAALGVETAEVVPMRASETTLAYVSLEIPWQRHAFVASRVGGRIAKLYVAPGEVVTAGQKLVELESLELETLQLEMLDAHNDLQLSQNTLDRLEPLAARGVTAGRELQAAQAQHAQNQIALDIARTKLVSLGLDEEALQRVLETQDVSSVRTLPLEAPIAGTVLHTDLVVGKVVGPEEHLVELIDLSRVWARIDVLEKDINRIELGQRAVLTLAAYPDEQVTATIEARSFKLDPQSHLGTVWAELENSGSQPARYLPGMNGQALIETTSGDELPTVPAQAVVRQGAEQFVLVEQSATNEGSEYRKVNVLVTRRTRQWVQLGGGDVFPGDRVVIVGNHELAGYFIHGVLRLSEEAMANIGLQMEPVQRKSIEQVVELEGSVQLPPDRRAFASAPLSGRVRSLHVDRGQRVTAGEVIAEVESLEFQNLQLDLLQTSMQLDALDLTLEQLRASTDAVARSRLIEAESRRQTLTNRRESVQRKLRTAGMAESDLQRALSDRELVRALPVRAPIDGVLVDFKVAIGEVVQASEPLFEVHDLDQLLVQGYVSEREVGRVAIGQLARLRFTSLPGVVLNGEIVRSGHVLGAQDRTLSVWLELDELPPEGLLHNMLATVTVATGSSPPVLSIPVNAVLQEGTQSFVFRQEPGGTFQRQPIAVGQRDDRRVEVISGLRGGELIAVEAAEDLRTAFAAVR